MTMKAWEVVDQHCEASYILTPSLLLAKCLGVLPSGTFSWTFVACYVQILISFTYAYMTLMLKSSLISENAAFFKPSVTYAMAISVGVYSVGAITTLVTALRSRKCTKEVLRKALKLQSKSTASKYIIVYLTASLVLCNGFKIYSIVYTPSVANIIYAIVSLCVLLPCLAVESLFAVVSSLVEQTFCKMADEMETMLDVTPARFENESTETIKHVDVFRYLGGPDQDERSMVSRLARLLEVYLQLCDLVQQVGERFRQDLLVSVMTGRLQTALYVYVLVTSLFGLKQHGARVAALELHFALAVVFYAYRSYKLCHNCEELANQARRCSVILNEMTTKKLDKHTRNQIYLLASRTEDKAFQFSGNGYFTLNYPLLSSFVGSIIAYLVILIQFETA